jgi:hypothetical protein
METFVDLCLLGDGSLEIFVSLVDDGNPRFLGEILVFLVMRTFVSLAMGTFVNFLAMGTFGSLPSWGQLLFSIWRFNSLFLYSNR